MTVIPPSDASSAALNPPKRQMPAFLQNMQNANQNIICTAKGDDVRKNTVAEVFAQRLRIPIFQRRYCWSRDQWHTLLSDALTVADGGKEKHALGRITCIKSKSDGRVAVIDGQQRNTTCSLLLAAIRDVCDRHTGSQPCQDLSQTLNQVLLPGQEAFASWLRARSSAGTLLDLVLPEGEPLEFAALVPTYCDRAAYFAAILPGSAAVSSASCEWQRPMEAKQFFLEQLSDFSPDRLAAVADVVMHKLEWLFFPITIDDGYTDGTEDVHVIFERLAARDATWTKPTRETEYASMGAADFVRNLLLGSFKDEATAIEMYKKHWLPIEMAAAAASRRSHDSGIATFLESMLEAFLRAQPEKPKAKLRASAPIVGGDLYARFRRWLLAALESDSTVALGETDSEAVERKTSKLLHRLHEFAGPHLQEAKAPLESARPADMMMVGGGAGHGAPKLPRIPAGRTAAVAKWRCSRCSFANPAGMSICTACMLQRP